MEADLLSQKVESLTSKLSAAESEKQGLLLQNAGQVSKIAEITGAIEDLRHKTSGLQFQLEEAARVRERLQISLDSVSEAADSANDKLLLRRQELCVLEEKVIEKNSLVLRLEVELEEVRNEFERSNREKEWAISSKAEVDRELEELRARLLKQNLELKANLEAAQVSQSVQVERLKSLENENSGMVRQIVDLQDRLEQVTSSKTALEAEFIAEIASKSKISDLYKEGMESLAKKVEELESMISNGESLGCGGLVKAFSPNTLFTSDRLSKNHNELSIDELCKSGQVENLQHAIQCMCEEVEARAAQVKSQADELENLRGTVSVLSKNLAESAKMKEQQSAETICIREGLKSLEYELTMKEQTIVDLTRQVHVLLAESEGVKP